MRSKIFKSIGLALIVSIVSWLLFISSAREINFEEIIASISLGHPEFIPSSMMLLTLDMFPVFLFQFFFGIIIYKHFCECASYYFIRYKNRAVWYFKEITQLLIFSLCYCLILFISYYMITALSTGFILTLRYVNIVISMALIFSLYTFIFTLLLNIMSISFGSQRGLIICYCIQVVSIFELVIHEKLRLIDMELIKFNPVANLIFAWHSFCGDYDKKSELIGFKFEISVSFTYYIIYCIITITLGYYIVKKKDIALENMEYE